MSRVFLESRQVRFESLIRSRRQIRPGQLHTLLQRRIAIDPLANLFDGESEDKAP
jgi:hypothetical protein